MLIHMVEICMEVSLADLLRGVSETGVARIRFATSHPKDISDEAIEAFGTLTLTYALSSSSGSIGL